MRKKLIFINPKARKFNLASQGFKIPPLNLAYLAAVTPDHWDINIYDENYENAPEILKGDLVGITTLTSTINRAYELAERYRKQGLTVILGGIHASMVPDEAEKYADAVVIGEAESIWKRVVDDFLENRLAKRYQGEPLEHFAQVYPRRDLLSSKYMFGSIQTSRGCPFDCEFCSVKAFNGSKFRQREAEDVLRELNTIPQKFICFVDDNLIGYGSASQRRAKLIFQGMIDRKLNKRWVCQTSINFADDEELLDLAARSGCFMALVGIESIDPCVLSGTMNKKANASRGADFYYELIKRAHKHKITILGNMIFGNDEERERVFALTSEFYDKSGLDIPWPGMLVPYPGTRLYERLQHEGRILFTRYPEDWERYNSEVIITPKPYPASRFFTLFKAFVTRNYSFAKIWARTMRTWIYSRSFFRAIIVYNFNRSLRRRFDKGLRAPEIIDKHDGF